MAEKPSISDRYKLQIAQPLQDAVDEIALNSPLVTGIPADLDDNKKRWLVVGICLHSIIAPALRNYIVPILTDLYDELNRCHKIDTQIYSTHLQKCPPTNFFLNYEAVNKNKAKYGSRKENYDYTIKNAVDLSKLFLPTYIARYTGFDETCETSGLLELVINIDKFAPVVRSDAYNVRRDLRNPWAHCEFTKWDAVSYSNAFKLMEKLVLNLSLNSKFEDQVIGKLKTWEINGDQFLSGTTLGLELVNEIRHQTCVLGEYVRQIATGTDDNFMKINNKILLINKIDLIKKDMEEIDTRLKAQDDILKNQHTQLEDFSKNLNKCACHDSHTVEMELWNEQEVMFVETPVVEDISQMLESEHRVLVVGEPGIGKSMLMHHIALKLNSTTNYNIIPCSTIKDIIHHYKENRKQMFVLDDICGRFTASFGEIEYLQKKEETIKRMLEKGRTKIAATCRLDIYSDEKFYASCTVFTSNIFNLSEEYSKENKLTICAKYLTETNIQLLKVKNEAFTPLMCYLYSKNENFNLTDFLHCPYETYQNEWDKLKSIDPYKYCALFLCVLHNGSVKKSLFDIYSENISSNNFVLENIFEICGLNRGTSRCKMETVFDSMIGTYVRKMSNGYRVIHDQMFDFMCGYFGNKDTMVRCILRDACFQVLNERTQLESINEKRRKFTLLITHKHEQEYFMRIQNELQLGNVTECSHHPQMNHDTYRASFIKVLKSIEDNFLFEEIHPGTFSKKYNESYSEFLIASCSRGYYDIVQFYVSKDADLENSASFHTPLTAACVGGHEKIVQLLIDKGCDVNQADSLKKTPITAACKGGNEKIVQLLIEKGCNVNQVDCIGQIPLTVACWTGNDTIVQLLIDKGCNVNHVDEMKQTPLTVACEKGNEKIVQLLIDKGCNVNHVDGITQTPLTAACVGGHENIVQLLLDTGFYVSKADGMGQTLLTVACKRGNEKIVKLLIDKGFNVNHADGKGQTPLIAACEGGHDNIVQLLIDNRCNVNHVDGMGQTPLIAACEGGYKKIVQLLIDKGCNVNQVDGMKRTALTVACKKGDEKIVHLLIDRGCNVNQFVAMRGTALTIACWTGNESIVQLLIDKGCYVNHVDGLGQTPLTTAFKNRNEKIVELLLDKGCNVNYVDGMIQTPLTAACGGGNEKMVQLLIDKGCNINDVDGMSQTPLTAACGGGYEKIVQLLIDKGYNVNQDNDMRRTPLTVACGGGYEKIVQLLIDKGCYIDQIDGFRLTPLTAACGAGYAKIVQLLIDKGCYINQIDGTRRTPLTAACEGGKENIVQLLIDKGSNINQVDDLRQTPLIAACKKGNVNIVQLLIDKGCNVHQGDGMSQTPLVAACYGGNENIVQLLIDKGYDVTQVDGWGKTPLTVAREEGNERIVQLLIDKGCDVYRTYGMGETPITAARRRGHKGRHQKFNEG